MAFLSDKSTKNHFQLDISISLGHFSDKKSSGLKIFRVVHTVCTEDFILYLISKKLLISILQINHQIFSFLATQSTDCQYCEDPTPGLN